MTDEGPTLFINVKEWVPTVNEWFQNSNQIPLDFTFPLSSHTKQQASHRRHKI